MAKARRLPDSSVDMTPMIDMTFQLIAFFMILINFSEADQDARVVLPKSELAKPPDGPAESPITVNIDSKGKLIIAGQLFGSPEAIKPLLNNEKSLLQVQGKSAANATIIIRAHQNAQTGAVQAAIRACQESGFEKFTLRAKEDLS